MTNNTLFCGVVLVAIGLYSFFADSPSWDKRVGQFIATHDAAVEKYAAEKESNKELKEPNPNKKLADFGDDTPEKKKLVKEPGKQSMTALIPAGLGAVLLLMVGVVIYKPDFRKHAMHLAAVVGLAAVLGGAYAAMGGMNDYNLIANWSAPSLSSEWPSIVNNPDGKVSVWDQPKVRSGGLTALVGLVYVGLAVKSFIDARKAQAAAKPAA